MSICDEATIGRPSPCAASFCSRGRKLFCVAVQDRERVAAGIAAGQLALSQPLPAARTHAPVSSCIPLSRLSAMSFFTVVGHERGM